MEPTIIYTRVFDPSRPSIFGKNKKSARAEFTTVKCSYDKCPLREQGRCILLKLSMFGGERCPYGTRDVESGPTQRSNKFYTWVKDKMDQEVRIVQDGPACKLAFIGDFVYVPYSHANMCKSVPFTKHSEGFTSGSDFIPREHWTIENLLKLIDFRPHAMFGGEISDYQKEVVPMLIQHVRELDEDMWQKLVAERPHLDTTPDYIGRKALLRTLANPIVIPPKKDNYPVEWYWDGKKLSTDSVHAYNKTWGDIAGESVKIQLTPEENASVIVKDNAWVLPSTVFVD